ncbi:MAG: PilZ domain-containing protein [Desulfarculus sp.]|nr:PilZ domain-containing protein [Desulfarculus sp.]
MAPPALLRLKDPGRRALPTAMAPVSVLNVSLPPQEQLLERFVRPRQPTDLILDLDLESDRIDIRHSTIEDFDAKGRLVLSQSDPPLLASHRGRMAEVTFLAPVKTARGRQWLRLGYRTPVRTVLPEYKLRPGVWITAIVVDPPRRLEPCTVRMAPRLTPSADMDLRLMLLPARAEMEILDISAGGLFFAHPGWMSFGLGGWVNLLLHSGELGLDLSGRVVREEALSSGRGGSAVQFEGLANQERRRIRQLTLEMNRHLHLLRLEEPYQPRYG